MGNIRKQGHREKYEIRHASEQRARGLERAHDGLSREEPGDDNRELLESICLPANRAARCSTHRRAGCDREQPGSPQDAERTEDADVVPPTLDARLRKDERDPEGKHGDSINARPAVT